MYMVAMIKSWFHLVSSGNLKVLLHPLDISDVLDCVAMRVVEDSVL